MLAVGAEAERNDERLWLRQRDKMLAQVTTTVRREIGFIPNSGELDYSAMSLR